jgi:hypothetical protein
MIIVKEPAGHGQDNGLVAMSQKKQVVVSLNGIRDVGRP